MRRQNEEYYNYLTDKVQELFYLFMFMAFNPNVRLPETSHRKDENGMRGKCADDSTDD